MKTVNIYRQFLDVAAEKNRHSHNLKKLISETVIWARASPMENSFVPPE